MIFQPETCLYVSSIPKTQLHEIKFLIFLKWRIFSSSLLLSGKTAFLQISADIVTGLQEFFFHLKALQTRMQIDFENFFIAKVVPEISVKNTSFKISQMCIFVTHCRQHNAFLSNAWILKGSSGQKSNFTLIYHMYFEKYHFICSKYFCQWDIDKMHITFIPLLLTPSKLKLVDYSL